MAKSEELSKLLSGKKEVKDSDEKSWFSKKTDDLIAAGVTTTMTAALAHAAKVFFNIPSIPAKVMGAICSVGALFAGGLTAYLAGRKPFEPQASKLENVAQEEPIKKEASSTPVVDNQKYTPQEGEYWTGILQEKYDVDYETALKMTHRIKDVIYDDSLAAKQSPVMYLPKEWAFEGKTYKLNENKVNAKGDFSEDVKTEMGKMNKDIVYEK